MAAHSIRQISVSVLAGVLMLVAPAGVQGQQGEIQQDTLRTQPARSLSYRDAVRIALEQNTDLMRARDQVLLRDTELTRQRMRFLPDLQLSSGTSRTFGRSFSQEEGQILSETSDFFDADLSMSVDLFNGFERFASMRRAGLQEEASTMRLERTRQEVIFQVAEAFTSLLLARQLSQVRAGELEAQQELLEQVEGLVEVGRRPVSDLYQQQAARAEAQAALVEAERQAELAETGLIQLLHLDPLSSYAFEVPAFGDMDDAPMNADSVPVDSVPAPDAVSYDLEDLLATALARRTDLDAMGAEVAANRQGVRAARSGYWPSLSLGFGYGSGWSSTSFQSVPGTGSEPETVTITPDGGGEPVTIPVPGTGSDPERRRPGFVDQLDARRGGSVRISLSVPVFDRLQTHTGVQQAEVNLRNARYDLQDQQQLVALQVRQALLDYRSALAQQEATEERFQAARRAWDAALRRYDLGAATFVELTQVRSQYVGARSARVQAAYNVVLAQKLIEFHTGSLDARSPLFPTS